MWPEVPENEVVINALARELVSLGNQRSCKRFPVRDYLLQVPYKLRRADLEQLSGQGTNLVVVRPALQTWEDRHISILLHVS